MTPAERADALMAVDHELRRDAFAVLLGRAQVLAEDGDDRLLVDLESAVEMMQSWASA